MMEMLKSIFRMDEDQCARRVALKYFEVVDPGYYEFESKHVPVLPMKTWKWNYIVLVMLFFHVCSSSYIF